MSLNLSSLIIRWYPKNLVLYLISIINDFIWAYDGADFHQILLNRPTSTISEIHASWAFSKRFSWSRPSFLSQPKNYPLCLTVLAGLWCSFGVFEGFVSNRIDYSSCQEITHFYLGNYYLLFLIMIHQYGYIVTDTFDSTHGPSVSTKHVPYSC